MAKDDQPHWSPLNPQKVTLRGRLLMANFKEPLWASPSLDQMIAESGTLPVGKLDQLLGGWPEDELDDGFEEVYREERMKDISGPV